MRGSLGAGGGSVPESVVDRGGGCVQRRPGDGRWALATGEYLAAGQRHGGVVRVGAGDSEEFVRAEGVDDSADAAPVHGPRTHRAGLGAGVESGLGELLPAVRTAGPPAPGW